MKWKETRSGFETTCEGVDAKLWHCFDEEKKQGWWVTLSGVFAGARFKDSRHVADGGLEIKQLFALAEDIIYLKLYSVCPLVPEPRRN